LLSSSNQSIYVFFCSLTIPRYIRIESISLLQAMSNEYRDDPSFKPWGPLISPNYKNEAITTADIIIASIVFGLTLINVIIAVYLAYGQSKVSRSPLRSVYVWMIWLELVISFIMSVECFLHLLKYIKPSKSIIIRLLTKLLTKKRLRFLFHHPLLVVYPGPVATTNHHQPNSSYCSRSQVLETHHDCDCCVRHCN
jgi:hypothetical protein